MDFSRFVFRVLPVALALMIAGFAVPARAFIGVSINVGIAPPPLPVYAQPPIPAPGLIWTPGYWAWSPAFQDYYWVPGVWVSAPRVGFLWTPPWWGWYGGEYAFHAGYWGPHVGFYGGVAYGYGYTGYGYQGGYWNRGNFFYNRAVNNVTNVQVTNVYSKTVVNSTNRVSYNGGAGGLTARPTASQLQAAHETHIAPTALQARHASAAAKDPGSRYSVNRGHPGAGSNAKAAAFRKSASVASAHGGRPVAKVPAQRPAQALVKRKPNSNAGARPSLNRFKPRRPILQAAPRRRPVAAKPRPAPARAVKAKPRKKG